jgi:hypothetical protein
MTTCREDISIFQKLPPGPLALAAGAGNLDSEGIDYTDALRNVTALMSGNDFAPEPAQAYHMAPS